MMVKALTKKTFYCVRIESYNNGPVKTTMFSLMRKVKPHSYEKNTWRLKISVNWFDDQAVAEQFLANIRRQIIPDKAPSGQNWLNARKAAEYAGIGHTTLYDWIREGKLPFRSYPLAHRIRKFDPADIDAWRESRSQEAGIGPVFPRKRK